MAPPVQLIDADGIFTPVLEAWMQDENLDPKGLDYSVVTILGCQSSGKSTLLNELFGTPFQVMNAELGSRQTTRGLWLSKDVVGKEANLIIDVEGTDSKERGGDGQKFERRAALFSLAVADVVLVNILETDIGRLTGSNHALLEAVLGLHFERFQLQEAPPKTVLLFVIRDYSGRARLACLMEQLRRDLVTIWEEKAKPEHLKTLSLDDYFVLKIAGLPSYIWVREEFQAGAIDLREMLKRECRPESYSRRVPADGFAFYAKSVWDTIMKCEELNIPSQREMVAIYKCGELEAVARRKACERFSAYLSEARAGTLVERSFTWAGEVVRKALEEYDTKACHYQREVFLEKRSQLLQTLREEIQKIVDAMLDYVRQSLFEKSKKGLSLLGTGKASSKEKRLESWAGFNAAGSQVIWEAQRSFDETSAGLRFEYQSKKDGRKCVMQFEGNGAKQSLKEDLGAALARVRDKEMESFRLLASEVANEALGDITKHWAGKDHGGKLEFAALVQHISSSEIIPSVFWGEVSGDVSRAIGHLSQVAEKAFHGLQSSEDAAETEWKLFAARVVTDRLLVNLQSVCDWLDVHICARFQKLFVQKGESLTAGEFEEIYQRARQSALVLPRLFQEIRIICPEVTSEPLLTDYLATQQLMTLDKETAVVSKAREMMLEYKDMVEKGVVTKSWTEYISAVFPYVATAAHLIIPHVAKKALL